MPPVNCDAQNCAELGGFTDPFGEPVIFDRDPSTPASEQMAGASGVFEVRSRDHNNRPVRNVPRPVPMDDRCERLRDGRAVNCKPTAASIALLPDNRMLYFNALESTENVEFNIVAEGGQVILNDLTRLLGMRNDRATGTMPTPFDGGADEEAICLIPGGCLSRRRPTTWTAERDRRTYTGKATKAKTSQRNIANWRLPLRHGDQSIVLAGQIDWQPEPDIEHAH